MNQFTTITYTCDACGTEHRTDVPAPDLAIAPSDRMLQLADACKFHHRTVAPQCPANDFYRVMADLRLRVLTTPPAPLV